MIEALEGRRRGAGAACELERLAARYILEQVTEAILNSSALSPRVPAEIRNMAHEALRLDLHRTKLVILGGGTGLSTVVGGNSQLAAWSQSPFVGLKETFPQLSVIVCTTDDGGSTGGLLRILPIIGIGDLRKSLVALVRKSNLRRVYGMDEEQSRAFALLMRDVFHYRFRPGESDSGLLANPLLAASPPLRAACPVSFSHRLKSLGAFLLDGTRAPVVDAAGHCLGNLLLAAAIFRNARGGCARPPGNSEIEAAIFELSRDCGVTPGSLQVATATPGQLRFRYANGVEVYGQGKSAQARRGFPVDRVAAEFAGEARVSPSIRRALCDADLIIYAPGSLYTSILPILQLEPVVDAIRGNRKALKVLGANLWIQEGETDISLRREGREFLVSDLLEAYDRNVPGGASGLFDVVLAANLEHVPGNILRNYALEGKIPIHLDRRRVESLGCSAIEATLFEPAFAEPHHAIQHSPERFARAIQTLYYAWSESKDLRRTLRLRTGAAFRQLGTKTSKRGWQPSRHGPLLCAYLESVRLAIEGKLFRPVWLGNEILEAAWENRDISPQHLAQFSGACVLGAGRWRRSTAWDNVLGYYDPEDGMLKLHEQLPAGSRQLRANLLIAMGESLLGRYIESRTWHEKRAAGTCASRCYEIRLRSSAKRGCFLTDYQLKRYLRLARMIPDPADGRIFRISINDNEGFLPPGLMFGLLYAWYLDNSLAGTMEYEMSLLRWPPDTLIPHQAHDHSRKQALVQFFRTEVFGHPL